MVTQSLIMATWRSCIVWGDQMSFVSLMLWFWSQPFYSKSGPFRAGYHHKLWHHQWPCCYMQTSCPWCLSVQTSLHQTKPRVSSRRPAWRTCSQPRWGRWHTSLVIRPGSGDRVWRKNSCLTCSQCPVSCLQLCMKHLHQCVFNCKSVRGPGEVFRPNKLYLRFQFPYRLNVFTSLQKNIMACHLANLSPPNGIIEKM